MNVKELRQAMATVPDDYMVTVQINGEYFYAIDQADRNKDDVNIGRVGGGIEVSVEGTFDLLVTEAPSNQLVFTDPKAN